MLFLSPENSHVDTRGYLDVEVMGGMPCVPGTRVPVAFVVAVVEAGEDVHGAYPQLTEEQVNAAVEFARRYPELLKPKRRSRKR